MGEAGAASALSRVEASFSPVQFTTRADVRKPRHSFRKSAEYCDHRSLLLIAVLSALPPLSPSTQVSPAAYLSGCCTASCMNAKPSLENAPRTTLGSCT